MILPNYCIIFQDLQRLPLDHLTMNNQAEIKLLDESCIAILP
jgi:hypothetical protein